MTDDTDQPKASGQSDLLPGEIFLSSVLSLLHTARIYQADNPQVDATVKTFLESISRLLVGHEELILHLENGRFYLQEERLPRRKGNEFILNNMLSYFMDRGITGLKIFPSIILTSPEKILYFANTLNASIRQELPVNWMEQRFTTSRIDWVELSQEGRESADDQPEPTSPEKNRPRKVYAYALKSVKEVAGKISTNQRVGIRKAARMAQTMVEEVLVHEQPLLMAMGTIRAFDDYTFTHSVNVAIMSLYIGKEIGLPKNHLERLGICGLFHDLGKVILPRGLLNKPARLSEDEFSELSKHSLDSTRLIIKLLSSPAKRKAEFLLAPFEHHLKFDLSGYPDIGWNYPISLFGRIIAIADVYDALTSARVYRKEALSPDRALGMMLKESGVVFDPVLLKVFINMLGVYPVGTVLELDTGEKALVSKPPSGKNMDRPWVVTLTPDGRGGYIRGQEINLADQESSGKFHYNVKSSSHPARFNIQPAQFLS